MVLTFKATVVVFRTRGREGECAMCGTLRFYSDTLRYGEGQCARGWRVLRHTLIISY